MGVKFVHGAGGILDRPIIALAPQLYLHKVYNLPELDKAKGDFIYLTITHPSEPARREITKCTEIDFIEGGKAICLVERGREGTKSKTFAAGSTVQLELTRASLQEFIEDVVANMATGLRSGATGPTGPKGDMGPTGPKGDMGPTGPKGEEGGMGPTGERGPKGSRGTKGGMGDTGPTGPKGEVGPHGRKGDMGPTGPKGEKGERGDIIE